MILKNRKTIDVWITFLLIAWIPVLTETKKSNSPATCPIGFSLAYTKEKSEPICYRLKGPEKFDDKFVDCVGNLYSHALLIDLSFTPPNVRLWSDYRTLYAGGPFIDWSYADTTGNILTSTFQVAYSNRQGLDEEFCTILEPYKNLTAVNCHERHHRYCFVRPYEYWHLGSCKEHFLRFWSPRASCLHAAQIGKSVGVTWIQARELCARDGAYLLQRGWRYANHPDLHFVNSSTYLADPLGLVMTSGAKLMWLDSEGDKRIVAKSEWNFQDGNFSVNNSLVALEDDKWQMINNTHLFHDVICEIPVRLPTVAMVVENRQGHLVLTVNDTKIRESDIWCFSDSVIFYPSRVKITQIQNSSTYELTPITDGYYWCVHSNTVNYTVSESNKELFIRDQRLIRNLYATKIRIKRQYSFENLDKLLKIWTRKMSEFIYYRSRYLRKYGDFNTANKWEIENILKRYKKEDMTFSDKVDVIFYQKIKRVYLDRNTVLLHTSINPEMEPLLSGYWEDLEVIFMRPTYNCPELEQISTLPLGEQMTVAGCHTYTCVGDFNEGVQWLETVDEECAFGKQTVKVHSSTADLTTETVPMARQFLQTTIITATSYPEQEDVESSEEFLTTEITVRPELHKQEYSTDSSISTDEVSIVDSTDEVSIVDSTDEVSIVDDTTEGVMTTFPPWPLPPWTTPAWTTPAWTFPPRPPPFENLTTTVAPNPPPEQQVQDVLDVLEHMLQNDSVPVHVQDIKDAFDQVDDLLDIADDVEIPGSLLHLLDQLGARADLEGLSAGTAVRNNVALLMADSRPDAPVRGLRIATRDQDSFTEDAFQLLSDQASSTYLEEETSEAIVHLPESVGLSERRISFVVFRTSRAFLPAPGMQHYSVNSRVLSINVENLNQFDEGEVIDILLRPVVGDLQRNESRTCAYWNFFEDGTGMWSRDGCTFIRAPRPGMLDTCRCNHLTHFAEVLAPRAVFSEQNENALEVISIVGCIVSVLGLLLIGLTAMLFRSWRRDFNNKVWLQLCIAIMLLVICFLVVVFAKFDTYTIPCMLIGVALHYAVLVSFCWMLVAAIISYRRLVLVFSQEVSHKLLRSSVFAWGAPCFVVGVLLSVNPQSYAGRFEEKTPSAGFCYPTGLGLWLALYAPVAVMLLANWTLFVLIVRSVYSSHRVQRHGGTNEALRCATVSCLLVFLFGLPWIFGLFAYNVVFAYLFTLLATFQGFVLFIFFVVANKKTRDMWLNKLKIKQKRKVPVTSSTYKSSGRQPGSSSAILTQTQYTKPRALVVSDDSGFS